MQKLSIVKAAIALTLGLGCASAMADGTAAFGSDLSIGAGPSYTISTAQGGLVYGYTSCYGGTAACPVGSQDWEPSHDFHYYTSSPDWYVTAFDVFGFMEGSYGPSVQPHAYFGITMTAPNTIGAATQPRLSVSDAKYVLVKMTNYCNGGVNGCEGTANALTLVLSNGANAKTAYQNPHTDTTATAICSSTVTLVAQGEGTPINPGTNGYRERTLYTYKVPVSSFKCEKGTLSKALSALSAVSVEMRVDQNAAAIANDTSNRAYDALQMPAVSRISFGK